MGWAHSEISAVKGDRETASVRKHASFYNITTDRFHIELYYFASTTVRIQLAYSNPAINEFNYHHAQQYCMRTSIRDEEASRNPFWLQHEFNFRVQE